MTGIEQSQWPEWVEYGQKCFPIPAAHAPRKLTLICESIVAAGSDARVGVPVKHVGTNGENSECCRWEALNATTDQTCSDRATVPLIAL
jgi:hypothetical protein